MTAEPHLPRPRPSLASQQASLVGALARGHPAPAGFDRTRVEATRQALLRKRAREAAKAWPALRRDLGDTFLPRFLDYAASFSPPAAGGPHADGLGFAERVRAGCALSDPARAELARARALWSVRRGRIRPRRVGLAATVLHRPRRVLVAAQLPGLGLRQLRLGG